MTIIDALDDRNLFGSLFKDPASWSAWHIFLKAVFALPMTVEELEVFRQCTGRERPPGKQVEECFAIVGRRGGKSYMAAIIACYFALFRDWKPFLSPGEIAWIMVIATDRAQAQNIFRYIKGILNVNHMFRNAVEADLAWEINLNNGTGIKIQTCNYRTLRGFTVVAAICDELSFWRTEGSNPAQEIFHALRPSLATIPGSMLIGISSPYSKSGPLYEAFREKYGQGDEDILIWKAPSKVMNPTIRDKIIEKAMREDPAAARAEWMAEFREDLETYLPQEIIDSIIIPGRLELPRLPYKKYCVFVDPAGGGGGGDSFTMAISHKERYGRIILDRLEERRPPFHPQDVIDEFCLMLRGYGIESVTGDRWAGAWPKAAFRRNGITYRDSDLNKSELYLEFLPLCTQRQVELLDNKRLVKQLRGLERRVRSGGRDQVDHFPGSHDDLSNATAGSCALVSRGPRSFVTVFGAENPWSTNPYDPSAPYPAPDNLAYEETREWTKRLEDDIRRLGGRC